MLAHVKIWGLWTQKQVSQTWMNNCTPQNTVGCSYLSMPETPVSGTKVLVMSLTVTKPDMSFRTLSYSQNGHFSNYISNCTKNVILWFKYHWNIFPTTMITMQWYWFRYWLWAKQDTGHYLKLAMFSWNNTFGCLIMYQFYHIICICPMCIYHIDMIFTHIFYILTHLKMWFLRSPTRFSLEIVAG